MGVYPGRDIIYLVMPTKVDAILSLMRQEQTEFRYTGITGTAYSIFRKNM